MTQPLLSILIPTVVGREKQLKELVNKTTQGLSKGGSVKKNKSLFTRKGAMKRNKS